METPAKLIRQEIRLTSVSDLRNHPKNPKKGKVDAIGESIDRNGFYGTLVAQVSTGYVLVGNHRLIAAKEKGLDSLPVAWVDCDDATASRILAADNRTSELGGYDNKLLSQLLSEIALVDDDGLKGTGFEPVDLDALVASLASNADLEPITGGEGTGSSGLGSLKWPGGECNLTDEEADALTAKFKAHTSENATGYGFVRALLDL